MGLCLRPNEQFQSHSPEIVMSIPASDDPTKRSHGLGHSDDFGPDVR